MKTVIFLPPHFLGESALSILDDNPVDDGLVVMFLSVCVCMCICLYMPLCLFLYMCVYIILHFSLFVCVFLYLDMSLCMTRNGRRRGTLSQGSRS